MQMLAVQDYTTAHQSTTKGDLQEQVEQTVTTDRELLHDNDRITPPILQKSAGIADPQIRNEVDLQKLLDLSNRLALDGEVTPVMAWSLLLKDQRIVQLQSWDFMDIIDNLLPKVMCYG